MKTVRNIVVAIPTVIFILAVALIVKISFSLKKGEVPRVLGFSFMQVQTGSMEPNIHIGDFIINKKCKSYDVDDVVSFYYDINNDRVEESVTHRIISLNDDGTITLRGDAITIREDDVQIITKDKIIGKVISQSTKIGKFFSQDLLKNRSFIFLILIGSLFIFMVYQCFEIFKLLKEPEAEATGDGTTEVPKSPEDEKKDLEDQIAKLQAQLAEKEKEENSEEGENND